MVYYNLAPVRQNNGQKGQGMTEYILIVLLIAIALIAAFGVFRDKLIKGVQTASSQIDTVTKQSSSTTNP